LKEKEIWTLKTDDEIYDPKFGIVYRELVKGETFEIILASAETSYASDSDLNIPPTHSDLRYSILGHTDLLFPALSDADFFKKNIGVLNDDAFKQIQKLRSETQEKLDVTFQIGDPIVYMSDRRYSFNLKNLRIINKLGQEVLELSLSNIPDNLVPILRIENSDSSELIENIEKYLEDIQKRDEIAKIMLYLNDQNIPTENVFSQTITSQITEISFNRTYSFEGVVAAWVKSF